LPFSGDVVFFDVSAFLFGVGGEFLSFDTESFEGVCGVDVSF
jgi:hypothetical protein